MRHDLAAFDWTAQRIARLTALWAEGHSAAEIGRLMGISKNAIVGKAHRLDLPGRPSPIITRDPSVPKTPRVRIRPSTAANPRRVRPPTDARSPGGSGALAASTLPALKLPEHRQKGDGRIVGPTLDIAPVVVAVPKPAGRVRACLWPIGHPRDAGFRFCGDPAIGAKPYCGNHCAVAYVGFGRVASSPNGNPNFVRVAINGSAGSVVHPGTFEEMSADAL